MIDVSNSLQIVHKNPQSISHKRKGYAKLLHPQKSFLNFQTPKRFLICFPFLTLFSSLKNDLFFIAILSENLWVTSERWVDKILTTSILQAFLTCYIISVPLFIQKTWNVDITTTCLSTLFLPPRSTPSFKPVSMWTENGAFYG